MSSGGTAKVSGAEKERNANFILLTSVNAHDKCHGMQRTPRAVVLSSAFWAGPQAAEVLLLSLVHFRIVFFLVSSYVHYRGFSFR